jgi:uncharacterized protein with FMN-binding domain
MKTFVRNYGLLAGLVATFVLIFILGGVYSRYMTSQIEVHANAGQNTELLAMVDGATSVVAFSTTPVVATYALVDGRGDYSPTLEGSYKVFSGAAETAVIYVVHSFGRAEDFIIAYAIDLGTDEVVSVKVLSNKETPYNFSLLGDAFYAQFEGMPLDDAALAVDAVADATYSSKGFEIGLYYAREQYAADYGFVIPTIAVTLNSVAYNLDPATFVAQPFIADVTYGDENVHVVVYLDASFSYAGIVSGTEPDTDVLAAIETLASNSGEVSANVGFVSYDAATRVLVLRSKGFSSNPIVVTVTLNATLDGIESYEVVSHESYDNEYAREDSGYAGGAVPAVENAFVDDYRADGVLDVDAVAGATHTSAAMRALIDLLDQFIASVGGE